MLISSFRTLPATASIKFNADAQAALERAEALRESSVLPQVFIAWEDSLIWAASKVWED